MSTFYLPQNRFWELLVGSGLAYVLFLTRAPHALQANGLDNKLQGYLNQYLRYLTSPSWKNTCSVLGMGLLVFGAYRISKDSHFPGTWTLLPVFGSALLILAGPEAWLNRQVLSHRFLVWFGLISFPLYLWHWPLLALARIMQGQEPSWWIRIIILLLSIGLAWLTYRLIEKPIRFGSYAHSKGIPPILITTIVVIGLAGYWDYREDGRVWKKRPDVIINTGSTKVADLVKKLSNDYYPCVNQILLEGASDFGSAGTGIKRCYESQFNAPVQVAILGDSFAEHLFLGLAQYMQDKNIMYFTLGSAPFLMSDSTENRQIGIGFDQVIHTIVNEENVKIIVLSANWVNKFESQFQGNAMLFEERLAQTVQFLEKNGKKVYLIDGVPNFSFDVNNCKYSRVLSPNFCTENSTRYFQESNIYKNAILNVENLTSLKVINLRDLFCNVDNCSMAQNGQLLFQDRFHLNEAGSILVGQKVSKNISEAK